MNILMAHSGKDFLKEYQTCLYFPFKLSSYSSLDKEKKEIAKFFSCRSLLVCIFDRFSQKNTHK